MKTLPSIESIAGKIDAEVGGSSLERLGAAAAIAEDLRQLGDSVVDRYVQAARADQRSWSQIGEALGVSKQAAQQRFVAQPLAAAAWPGLSEAASDVATRAVEEARVLRHRYLGTEHLLLALASDEGLAGAALKRVGVSPESARQQIHCMVGPGHSADSATLGITPGTKRVFEAARKEARRLGHRCADTEHLLLAVSESDGVAQQMLHEAGAEAGDVRVELAALLEHEAPELAAALRTPARRRRLGSQR
jgi:Clp amino terminal domain, pathogenicity island component